MKLYVGMRVKIRRPEDIRQHPSWTAPMEKYDNQVMEITSIVSPDGADNYSLFRTVQGGGFVFRASWATPVEVGMEYV